MKKIMFNDRYGLTKAVLEGRKTMTRRLCNFKVPDEEIGKILNHSPEFLISKAPYKVGEIVAVAQSYEEIYHEQGLETMDMLISPLKNSKGWSNKMFICSKLMPHYIRITGIRCERLQDITGCDAEREGICAVWDEGFVKGWTNKSDGKIYDDKIEAFAALIDKVSGRGTWQSNPYVWVYEFELIK